MHSRIHAFFSHCNALPRWAGTRRDVTRGQTVLLQYRKQWPRPGSERTPGGGFTLSEVDYCQRSDCLSLQHSSPRLEKPL